MRPVIAMEYGLSLLGGYWSDLSQWRPQAFTVYAMLATSVISTGFISRIAGGIPYVIYTVGFLIMYVCAYVANFLAKGFLIHGIDVFQRGVVYSFCGHIVGAVIVLILFRVKDGLVRRV